MLLSLLCCIEPAGEVPNGGSSVELNWWVTSFPAAVGWDKPCPPEDPALMAALDESRLMAPLGPVPTQFAF